MKPTSHAYYNVHITPMPEGVSVKAMRDYIKSAIRSYWKGQYGFNEPITKLEEGAVKVNFQASYGVKRR